MGEVLEFPSQQAQGLAFLERELRHLLAAKGADEQLIDYATGQLTDIYSRLSGSEQYSFSVELPAGLAEAERRALEEQINAGLAGIRRENHAVLLELAAQLVLAELKLFQHQRD